MRTIYFIFCLILIFIFSCKKDNDEKITNNLLGQEELSNASFTNMYVNSIAVDSSGAKWIGTDAGLFLLKEGKFYKFTYFKDKKINFLTKNSNDILVSTSSGAYTLQVYPDSISLTDSLNMTIIGGTSNVISVYGIGISGKKWLGSPDGLACFDNSKWIWNDEIQGNLGGIMDVRSMAFRDNDCFFGTYGTYLCHVYYSSNLVDGISGASKMTGGAEDPVNNFNGELTTDTIYCVFAGNEGSLWFGSKTGLTKNIGGTNAHTSDGKFDYFLRGQRVHCVTETTDNKMWAGTENGLYLQNGAEWTNYTTSNGLPGNLVLCITEDTDLTLWIGTNKGISHYSGNKFYNY